MLTELLNMFFPNMHLYLLFGNPKILAQMPDSYNSKVGRGAYHVVGRLYRVYQVYQLYDRHPSQPLSTYYVRIAQTHNIWYYKKNWTTEKLKSLYNSLPFIFECFHDEQHTQWREKHRENTKPESHQTSKMLFFLSSSSSSSDRLVQKLWFYLNGFLTKQQHFTLSSAPAHHFSTSLKSRKALQTGHWRTMAVFATPFSLLVCMCINPLATKHNNYSRLLN